jgi:hypothetical protein
MATHVLPIEIYRTLLNGHWADLHRCGQCARAEWYATGKPPVDNGFVPADRPMPHHKGCPNRP